MPKFKKVYTESYRSGFYHPISILILALITLTVALAIFANSGFFSNKNKPAQSPTPQPPPKSSPKISPDPSASWKTYTNVKYRYRFNYPHDFEIVSLEWTDQSASDPERWAIAVRKKEMMVFNVIALDHSKYSQEINTTEDLVKSIQETEKAAKVTLVSVDGINAYKIHDYKSKDYIVVIKNDVKFEIRLLDEELSNQILSTFKFM